MRLTGTWLHSSWRVAFGSVELLCWIGRLTDHWRGPMESKIIFDVSTKAFPWQFIWASVASLVVGGLLVFLKNLKFRRFSQIVGYFMIGSAFISAAYNSINWHVARSHQMKALASGDYQAVEGTVENFRPRPNDGSSNESFSISGHTFSYSDYHDLETTPCFNQSAPSKGPIHAGMALRIKFVNDCILQIEAMH